MWGKCYGTRGGPVTKITISDGTLSLHPGDEKTLTAELEPGNPDDPTVVWTSSDPLTVEITPDGLNCAVKVLKEGSATIKVTTAVPGIEEQCDITVTKRDVTGVTISPTSLTLALGGETKKLTATVAPGNTVYQKAIPRSLLLSHPVL